MVTLSTEEVEELAKEDNSSHYSSFPYIVAQALIKKAFVEYKEKYGEFPPGDIILNKFYYNNLKDEQSSKEELYYEQHKVVSLDIEGCEIRPADIVWG